MTIQIILFRALTLVMLWVIFVSAQMLGAQMPRWAIVVAALVGIAGGLLVIFGF